MVLLFLSKWPEEDEGGERRRMEETKEWSGEDRRGEPGEEKRARGEEAREKRIRRSGKRIVRDKIPFSRLFPQSSLKFPM